MLNPKSVRALDPKHLEASTYYTPSHILSTCTGISIQTCSSEFPKKPIFFFALDKNFRITTKIEGPEGLLDLKDKMLEAGYILPPKFGQVSPFYVQRMLVQKRSVSIRFYKSFAASEATRLYFQYSPTFGSFNSAVHSAIDALRVNQRLVRMLKMQRMILNDSGVLRENLDETAAKYLAMVHDPDWMD